MSVKQAWGFAKDEFIYGGHLLSLGSVSIVVAAALMLNRGITWDFLLITYLVTYVAYSYNRLKELKEDSFTNSVRTGHIKKYARIFPYLILCSILAIIMLLVIFGNLRSIIFISFIVLASLLYTKYFKGITRRIVGFKSFYVSLVWSLSVVFLAIYYSFAPDIALLLIFVFIFLRWIINTSFCDLKDVESDEKEGLLTFAVVLGKEKFVRYLFMLNLISASVILAGIFWGALPKFSAFVLLVVVYAFYYLIKSKETGCNINLLCDLYADGELALWMIFIAMGKYIL